MNFMMYCTRKLISEYDLKKNIAHEHTMLVSIKKQQTQTYVVSYCIT